MSLIEINWNPNRKTLRDFGRIAIVATLVLAILLCSFKGLAIKWGLLIFAFGVSTFVCSLISLKITRIIFIILICLTFPIGMVISQLLMAVLYFLLLTPVGIVFKLIGRDPLSRKFDSDIESYWLPRKQNEGLKSYFHQF